MASALNYTTPVGRLVKGSLYKPQDKDQKGNPLVIKSGPRAGQPTVKYYFGVAIPKMGEQHWAQTEWGAKIWQVGRAAFPQGQGDSPAFAWKITDGDSQVPNAAGKKPCDMTGHQGHWVINFTSQFPPKIYNHDGSQQLVDADAVKLGYFVQVNASVDGNGDNMKPGVFMNGNMVALAAYGEVIHVGPDATHAGFGGAPLPAGASATPIGGFNPASAPVPAAPAGAPQYGVPPVPVPATGVMTANPSSPPAGVPAAPNYAFIGQQPPVAAVPGLPPAPPPVAVPQAAPRRMMTPAAQGATYEQLIAVGWNDQLLITNGMMVMS